jgi:excisionase family DNA binding protein
MPDDERVETPKQLAERVGISVGKVRKIIALGQLEHVKIGSRIHIPSNAFSRFLENQRATRCQDETTVRTSIGAPNAAVSISPGQSVAAAASAQHALRIASKLKQPSENGCRPEGAPEGRVIPLKSS